METKQIITALASLAQDTRLAIYRLLVTRGPEGMAVGAIAQELGLANATLSFHLKELTNAGLVVAQPNGRSIICSANFVKMNELVNYLTENCCAAASCATTVDCGPNGATCKPERAAPRKANTTIKKGSTR